VVVPCCEEAEGIHRFHAESKRVLGALDGLDHRIVFVDDGSRDATLARLDEIAAGDPARLVYSLSRSSGHQIALGAGLEAFLRSPQLRLLHRAGGHLVFARAF